jgi:hypothetical protein
MKRIFLIALAAAVLLSMPLTAQAKVEFELGGYIRMDAYWYSQNGFSTTMSGFSARDNVAGANHGKFFMNANASRFNFTMKGPEIWGGGKVTGFIEVDFDGSDTIVAGTTGTSTNDSSFSQAKLRLRHAMFKINWPDREVMFGQYWSINSEMTPETTDSGAYCLYGATQLRIPQVRYTQKFTDEFNASLAIEDPINGRWGLNVNSANPIEAETSEVPMVEAKIRYEQDLYGKAAWYGKPRGFYVGVGAGYLRTRSQAGNPYTTWNALGNNAYYAFTAAQNLLPLTNNNYADHWLFLIENFTPIIPTTGKDLSGTMSLAHQWWIGQGVSAWRLDLPANDRYFTFGGVNGANLNYTLQFIKRYGGWAQLQYYWTNEIFTNLNFGFEKAFGFSGMNRDNWLRLFGLPGSLGYTYANGTGIDPVDSSWRAGITQWYQPVKAVKFGLQYNYFRTNYFQNTTVGSWVTKSGNNHSLMANAWYFF